MKKVAFVVSSIGGGGAEKSALSIVSELKSQGVDIELLAINDDKNFVETIISPISVGRKWKSGIPQVIHAIFKFRRILKSNKIETLVLNCDLPELFGVFSPLKTRLVLIEHANPPWSNRKLLGKFVRYCLSKRSIDYVVVSSHLDIAYINGAKPSLIQNPLMPLELNWKYKTGDNIERLVYVGRLSQIFKRPDWVLKIAEQLELPCLILGDGELFEALQVESVESRIPLEMPGFVMNPWTFFREGDLLIIPSSAEGDGLVLVEAVQRNIPFLATNIPDLNKYGIGELNYCNDIDQFVSKIRLFSNDLESLVVPELIRRKLITERDLRVICDKWKDLLY